MSELSKIFVKRKWKIVSEVETGENTFLLYARWHHEIVTVRFVPNSLVLLSVRDFPGWENLLVASREICSQFMHAEPICSYDAEVDNPTMHFMEWDVENPKARLREIVNQSDQVFVQGDFHNLKLYGGHRLEDYIDLDLQRIFQEAAVAHQKYRGIYGKDPSCCDVACVARADELGLFLEYSMTSADIVEYYATYCQVASKNGCDQEAIEALSHIKALHLSLDYIIYAICQKIGIRIEQEPTSEHRLMVDIASLLQWSKFYSDHMLRICPDKSSRVELLKKHKLGEDLTTYAPTGNWRDS